MSAWIDKDQCTGCGNCLTACPKHILSLATAEKRNRRGTRYMTVTDGSACLECGLCELMCTAGAIQSKKNGITGRSLLQKEKIAPHAGCCLGTLSKALADVIVRLGIEHSVVIFANKGSNINLAVELHSYTDDSFYEAGLEFKKMHPDKIVILICPSSKEASTARNQSRFAELHDEQVTIINTLDWFEAAQNPEGVAAGGSHYLEEMARKSNASFLARSGVRTPSEVLQLEHYVETAVHKQMEGKNFSVVEMVFPCFYRLGDRPQNLMSYDQINQIRLWFDKYVAPDYEYRIFLDR